MRIISAEEESQIQEKEEIKLSLPNTWWDVSYSYNFYSKKDNQEVNIIQLKTGNAKRASKKNKKEKLPMPSEWDFSKGDYRVQQTGANNTDAAFNSQIKNWISQNSLYPFLAFALIFTLIILSSIFSI